MSMSKKQVLIVIISAVAATVILLLLFALPVRASRGQVEVNAVSETAYRDTLVPYFLDNESEQYMKDVDHFIDIDPSAYDASAFREVYVEVDMQRFTVVPFLRVWVGIESIPEAYRDRVVCVTTGPLMTDCEQDNNKGNITFLVLRDGLSDEQLGQMANEISYKVNWTLAMGVDGWVHLA